MSYLVDDVAHFVMGAPYLTLARPRSAIAFLERVLRLRSECFTGLETYPALQVEPLEFFYVTARSLGMLDAASLEVMTTKLSWRGVVWGGWLALMRPMPAFAEILVRAATPRPDNLMWVECARALIEGRAPPSRLATVDALAAQVRAAIDVMRIERAPLRTVPSGDALDAIEAQRRVVRAAYRSGGAERALAVLQGTRLHEITMPYTRWVRNGSVRAAHTSSTHTSPSTTTAR